MNNRKKLYTMGVALITVVCALSSGCGDSSDESIIADSDNMANLIEKAQSDEDASTELSDIIEDAAVSEINGEPVESPEEQDETAKETVRYDAEYTEQNVNLHIDAEISIPDADYMSVYGVTRAQIDQDFLDTVRTELTGDLQLYDGSILSQKMSQEIDEEMQQSTQTSKKEYILTDHPSDGRLSRVGDLYAADSTNSYYKWQNSFSSDSEICYEISDASDGTYISLYAQNNPNYGSFIRYRSSKQGYIQTTAVVYGAQTYYESGDVSLSFLSECASVAWLDSDDVTDPDTDIYTSLAESDTDPSALTASDTEQANLSESEAENTAESFISDIGLDPDSYELCMSGKICELPSVYTDTDSLNSENTVYRREYVFRYVRSIDGVPVNNDAGEKFQEEYQGTTDVKREWCGESIVVYVNDDGVIGFDYVSPLEINETAVSHASLKDFDEIFDTFKQLAPTVYSNDYATSNDSELDVESIVLRYTCVSDDDDWESGLLVPVWDFIGTIYDATTNQTYKNAVIMSINAVDGSVIDRELGY